MHVGLAIKNFVGPTETTDVRGLYRYAEGAEALPLKYVKDRVHQQAMDVDP